jgi:predicted SAM-dependent methyltransferase
VDRILPPPLATQADFEATTTLKFAIARWRSGSKFRGKNDIRANIGCGSKAIDGYVNLDIAGYPNVDFWDCRKSLPFDDNSAEFIFAEHVFEHFEYKTESFQFLTECHRCLKKGGVLRIVVPDAGRFVSLYNASWNSLVPVRPLIACGDGYKDAWLPNIYKTKMELINAVFRQGFEHKYAYDFETLGLHMKEAGFEDVRLQEYNKSASSCPPPDLRDRQTESLYVEAIK